jgi:hypothetical protein
MGFGIGNAARHTAVPVYTQVISESVIAILVLKLKIEFLPISLILVTSLLWSYVSIKNNF